MRLRSAAFLLILVLTPFVYLQDIAAQDYDQAASPLSVTALRGADLGADCDGGRGFVAQFHYTGAKPLRGYLVVFSLADSTTGKAIQERSVQEARDSQQPMIEGGAEWTRTFCAEPMKIPEDSATVTPKIDVLDFADGSTWGPAALPASHRLIGMLNGLDFKGKITTELERYVSPVLPQKGPFPTEAVQSETIGPLKIESGVWRDEHGRDMLAVAVTNEGDTPIRGYLLTTSFLDPATGTRIRRVSTKQLETHGNPSDFLAPGSTWVADPRKFSYLSDGSLAPYKISVDLVVFADGSTFGPKKSAESDEVLGMFRGIDAVNPSSKQKQ